MRRFFVIIFFLFLSGLVYSQQEAQFSQNMFNGMLINPGYAGHKNAICATAFARQQWVGFKDDEGNKGNPESYSFAIDAPVKFLKGGLGLSFLQDQLGFEKNISVGLSYAYHWTIDYGMLGLGLRAGFTDKSLDFGQFKPITEGDPTLSGGSKENAMMLDFSLGAWYSLNEQMYAGLSVSQLRQATGSIGQAGYRLKRHYFFTGGYNIKLASLPAYDFTPSVFVKSDLSSTQIEFNTLVTYNRKFWAGLSYRTTDALVAMLGLRIDQYSVGYAYDFTTSSLGRKGRSYGSHEIVLRYCFQLEVEKLPQPHRTVRFL